MLPDTRYSLIARLSCREQADSWCEFLETYQTAIIRYCRSRGLQDADAAEVAQEVLLAVHQSVESWIPSGRIGSFRAWLFETARRASLKSIRQRSRHVNSTSQILDAARIEDEPAAAIAKQDEEDWQRWLFYAASGVVQTEVTETTWQAFWQTAVVGRTPEEVSGELGISIGSVYTARCRVISRIRKHVEEMSVIHRNRKLSP